MKKTIITTAVLLLTMTACAQKVARKDVPETLTAIFKQKYPVAQMVSWEKEGANYEVEFEQEDDEISVLMDGSGNILETEKEMETERLPERIAEYVELNYKGQKIRGAAKITLADGTVNYEAELKDKDLIFDVCGAFIKEIILE